jgi:tetratricopeptide (TPR) repeat protein
MRSAFKSAVFVLIFLFPAYLYPQSAASIELNLGTVAYRNARYEEAIQHFERAVALDPENGVAHMYLATAYAQNYIPGAETPESKQFAEKAIEQYQQVLNSHVARSARIDGSKGIAFLYLSMKNFEDAKKYNRMASDLDPEDPEPYFSIGVIDWTLCYQPRMEQRTKLGLKPEEALNPKDKAQKKECDELKAKSAPLIAEGIDSLKKAIRLRPDYDDAMAYMNLMYRERADVECDDLTARDSDFKIADDWVDKTLAVKKVKAEKADKRLPQRKSGTTAPNPQ